MLLKSTKATTRTTCRSIQGPPCSHSPGKLAPASRWCRASPPRTSRRRRRTWSPAPACVRNLNKFKLFLWELIGMRKKNNWKLLRETYFAIFDFGSSSESAAAASPFMAGLENCFFKRKKMNKSVSHFFKTFFCLLWLLLHFWLWSHHRHRLWSGGGGGLEVGKYFRQQKTCFSQPEEGSNSINRDSGR